jgi:hypothetical protein
MVKRAAMANGNVLIDAEHMIHKRCDTLGVDKIETGQSRLGKQACFTQKNCIYIRSYNQV